MNTMGAPLVAGRDFTWDDIYELRPVAMVSENLARELWGQPSAAIGKRIRPYPRAPGAKSSASSATCATMACNEKAPTVAYWPLMMEQFSPTAETTARLRAAQRRLRDPQQPDRIERIRRRARTGGVVDQPNLPLASVRTLQEIYDASLARTSFTLVMLGIAGGMALLLGVAGIYGVISYSVSQRTREIGIRIALGAQARGRHRMFVAHGLMLAGVGVAIGLAAAFG